MAERKLILKKKLSAIKIQKFWKARMRRRKVKLEHIRYVAAVRTLQRFFKRVKEQMNKKREIIER